MANADLFVLTKTLRLTVLVHISWSVAHVILYLVSLHYLHISLAKPYVLSKESFDFFSSKLET